MIKRLAVLVLFFTYTSTLFAQDVEQNTNSTPPIVKQARDFVMLDFTYNGWTNKSDTIKTKSIGYGFRANLCYDFPIKKSHMSFAAGLGINTSAIYLDGQILPMADTAAAASVARFLPDTFHYKRYKVVTTYLTAPLELRYFGNKLNRNKGFKAAIGAEVGLLLGSHTKGVLPVGGTDVNIKEDSKRYASTWNLAGTARIGWGHFTIFGSYNVTSLFKQNYGPQITPFSLGICLTGL